LTAAVYECLEVAQGSDKERVNMSRSYNIHFTSATSFIAAYKCYAGQTTTDYTTSQFRECFHGLPI